MNNRKAPMSFNTLKRSNREERLIRRQQGRMVLLAIFAVIILLAVTGLVFLICHLVHNHKKPDPQEGLPTDIVYAVITKDYGDIHRGDLILVNADHAYVFPSTPIERMTSAEKQAYDVRAYCQLVNGQYPYKIRDSHEYYYLNPTAAAALNRMLMAYGHPTMVVYEGYRSYDAQASMPNSSVRPGYSEHHTGLAVSLSTSDQKCVLDRSAHSYLYETCYLYGFIERYPEGKTPINDYTECFRYVGVPHAAYIHQNKLTLEGYVEHLRKNHSVIDENTRGFNQSAQHLIIDVDQNGVADYAVYYIPANTNPGELSTLYVPQNYAYTVSGDNIAGFIVTVDLASKNG
jgi:D-alanyl-D-alanine carboxypeptidase